MTTVPAGSTNGMLQKVLVALATAAMLAGAGALITQAQLETKVKANTQAVEKTSDTQVKLREEVAAVKVKVQHVEEAVEKNGDKLDRILDKLP